jgi:LmbE family N-acetylglucosaminyl deacetylase
VKKKALVIAAHPDDEVLGCGGTIARLTQEGYEFTVAILGEGITSRFAQREEANPELLRQLHARATEAGRIVGVCDVRLFKLPDNRFDTVPLLDIVKMLESLISELHPEIVFTQHGGDLNIDHVVAFRATLTATRPLSDSPVRQLYAYEVASSTEWAFQYFAPVFQPNAFFDITGFLDKKISAIEIYESERRAFPHPRSPEALAQQAGHWGSVVGVHAAEAFQLVRARY